MAMAKRWSLLRVQHELTDHQSSMAMIKMR
jgi:hypothetical protein